MNASRTDNRQLRQRNVLDSISNNTNIQLSTILDLINIEIKSPLSLSMSGPNPQYDMTILNSSIQTVEDAEGHKRSRQSFPLNGYPIIYPGGVIYFPHTTSDIFTISSGILFEDQSLTMGPNKCKKIMILIDESNQIRIVQGGDADTKQDAQLPPIPTFGIPIGYTTIQSSGTDILPLLNEDVVSYVGNYTDTRLLKTKYIRVVDGFNSVTGSISGVSGDLVINSANNLKMRVNDVEMAKVSPNGLETTFVSARGNGIEGYRNDEHPRLACKRITFAIDSSQVGDINIDPNVPLYSQIAYLTGTIDIQNGDSSWMGKQGIESFAGSGGVFHTRYSKDTVAETINLTPTKTNAAGTVADWTCLTGKLAAQFCIYIYYMEDGIE
jgi:hypothetical protein